MSAAQAWAWLRRLRRRMTLSRRGISLSVGVPGLGLRLIWRSRWPRKPRRRGKP